MSYACLHAHSELSVRDSILRIKDYVSKCKELGIESAALSEHGNMSSAHKFYKTCKSQGVKPIIGQEFYYAENCEDKGVNYHICVYAKNNIGLNNLFKLSSFAYTQGFFRKPRIDKSYLSRHSEGLIVTTACMAGMAQQLLLSGDKDAAVQELEALKSIFNDDLYLEIHDHGIEEEVLIKDFFRNYNGIKKILGTDVHFLNADDKHIHNLFKQLAYGSVGKSDDDGFSGSGYHVHNIDEIKAKFTDEEIHSTLEIADKCDISIKHNNYHLPSFELPSDHNSFTFLRDMCYSSLKQKGLSSDKVYVERLDYELTMLHLANLENYALIVADYMNWCKKTNIYTSPGRGSMAGSIVSWLTGITSIDPLKYDLLFSRAVNPGRCLQYDFGV